MCVSTRAPSFSISLAGRRGRGTHDFPRANIKHIVHKNDKDESKIVEIFNDIKNELKTHDLELRIQELESKFAEDFNQNTFDEIRRLKKEQNIN